MSANATSWQSIILNLRKSNNGIAKKIKGEILDYKFISGQIT
ncbi:hypothetical protein [Helicobacter sp. UBA3407]|nr:hypothetical protein [Helicobacter sp. UBA3407]